MPRPPRGLDWSVPLAGARALLAMADFYGTLAAARSLRAAGMEVTVADWRRLVPALWSRAAARTVRCPDIYREPRRFLDWLLGFGEREPGQVLCATSDDLAWLYARHREELQGRFRLYLPPHEAIDRVLNKWRLHEACLAAGVDVPRTWLPASDADLARVEREAEFPVLLKPQTQAFLWPHHKGRVVRSREALAAEYRQVRARSRYAAPVLEADPGVERPMVQAFHESASGVYSLSGFADASGELFVAAASRKLLQCPRLLGVGLCFEEAEVVPDLARRLRALCRHVGYHGVFEVEFVEAGGRHLLIDFNPRFYGQLAFDVARGLDLPRLGALAALGDPEALRQAVAESRQAVAAPGRRVFCHRIQLEIYLRLLRLTGRMSRDEARRWREWLSRNRDRTVDAVIRGDDWLPGMIEAAAALVQCAIHPRSTLRAATEC